MPENSAFSLKGTFNRFHSIFRKFFSLLIKLLEIKLFKNKENFLRFSLQKYQFLFIRTKHIM